MHPGWRLCRQPALSPMTAESLNAFLADLTSFSKAAQPKAPAGLDWEELGEIVWRHGLVGIVSYQLDYRFLARLDPPARVREQLASGFNAFVNDNVLKVTRLRTLLSADGMPAAVVLGPAGLVDALYPHVAFRPIEDVDLWLAPDAFAPAQRALAESGLALAAPSAPLPSRPLAARLASPDIALGLWRAPAGLRLDPASTAALWERRLPVRAYGPSAFRLGAADAVLAQVAALALEVFAVPRIRLVDLREMILRADTLEGFHGPGTPQLRSAELLDRARAFGLTRALWAGLRVVARLFPEATGKATALAARLPVRAPRVLDEAIVRPALDLNRTRVVRATVALRRLLLA